MATVGALYFLRLRAAALALSRSARSSGSVNGLRILPLCDSPMLQADVVLFAGVLHDHVVRGLQGPRPYVHPIVSVGLRIMNRHRVQDRTRVGTREGVDELAPFGPAMLGVYGLFQWPLKSGLPSESRGVGPAGGRFAPRCGLRPPPCCPACC